MPAPAKVSKNAREGKRQVQVKHLCPRGHQMTHVQVVGVGFRWLCGCRGYTPIDTSLPYAMLQDRFTGKTRLPQRDQGCTLQRPA